MYGLTGGTFYTAIGYIVTAPPGNAILNIGGANFTTLTPPDTTPPTLTDFFVYSKGTNYVEVYAAAVDGGSGVSGISLNCSNGANQIIYSSSGLRTFSGLSPSTLYSFTAQPFDIVGNWASTSSPIYATTNAARPTNFTWTYPKLSGVTFNLTAGEWNALTAKINEFRVIYKGMSSYGFAPAYSSNAFEAYYYQQAVNAINEISGRSIDTPPLRYKGDVIKAADLNQLLDSLHSTI
jgi:hypothetical protein